MDMKKYMNKKKNSLSLLN